MRFHNLVSDWPHLSVNPGYKNGKSAQSSYAYSRLRSDRSADLRSLRWCGIERLAGGGYMRIAHRVARGKIPDRPPKSYATP
jgi:hypothetical protein